MEKKVCFYHLLVAAMVLYTTVVILREAQGRVIINKLNRIFENSTRPVSKIIEQIDQKRKEYMGVAVEKIYEYHSQFKEFMKENTKNVTKTDVGNKTEQSSYKATGNDLPEVGFIPWKRSRNAKGYLPAEVLRGHKYLWERTYPKHIRTDLCNKCFKYEYKNLIVPKVCDGLPKVDIILLVTTVPSAIPQRKAIRDTWGSWSLKGKTGNISRHIFMFGSGWNKDQQKILDSEAKQFGDIQQDDYIDSYFNLSIKVLGGYQWVKHHCNLARFVVRTADDNFVNVPNIIELVTRDEKKLEDIIVGQCAPRSIPFRSAMSKWYITRNEYPGSVYPPYCMGTTFLTSNKLTMSILEMSQNVPFFVIEDVYFGMVMKELYKNKKPGVLTVPGFHLRPPPVLNRKVNTCPLLKDWMAVHEVPPGLFQNYWNACSNKTLLS